jgi:cell division protein FtsZ
VIQNYLLSQAGEDTDVILGLGYDNTLGAQIGITLIATGFEHKDPFAKEPVINTSVPEAKSEKIVMHLDMPTPVPTTKKTQPTLQFEEPAAEPVSEEKTVVAETVAAVDPLMPTLAESTPPVELPSKNTVEKLDDAPVFFEISSAADQIPVVAFDIAETIPVPPQKPTAKPSLPVENISEKEVSDLTANNDASNKSALSSGSFLAKPAQIYAEAKPEISESNTNEEPLPLQLNLQADEPVEEMQLVVKDSQKAAEEQPIVVQQTQPIMMSPVEEPAMQDETDELRRRATERIAKLRNLSFNINAADPNNEFETVPAYLRRNMEIHNQIANVENFYSNYTVKTDDNNQAEISTINTFLDGKKPD